MLSSFTSTKMDENSKRNPLQKFIDQLFQYITGENISNKNHCNLIKQNKDRLSTNGDFSFSNKRHVWMSYMSLSLAGFCMDVNCKHSCNGEALFVDDVSDDADADAPKTDVIFPSHSHYTITKLLAVSNSFALPVARVNIVGDWCNVHLDRLKCFGIFLHEVLLDNGNENRSVGQGCERLTRKPIRITSDHTPVERENCSQSVTDYRLKLLQSVVKSLINESDYWVLCQDEKETSEKPIHVHFTTKSSTVVGSDSKKIVSGNVADPKNGNKLAIMTADEYIK